MGVKSMRTHSASGFACLVLLSRGLKKYSQNTIAVPHSGLSSSVMLMPFSRSQGRHPVSSIAATASHNAALVASATPVRRAAASKAR